MNINSYLGSRGSGSESQGANGQKHNNNSTHTWEVRNDKIAEGKKKILSQPSEKGAAVTHLSGRTVDWSCLLEVSVP